MISTGRARPLVALLVLGAHLWLAPFAYADPPDLLWTGGIFDESDYDDVVLLVMAMTSVVETNRVFDVPSRSEVFVEAVAEPPFHAVTPARARPIRAPPAA